jgi:Na+/proline symporter
LNFNPQANKVVSGSSYENEYKSLKNKLNEIHFEKVSKINEIIEEKKEIKKIELIKLENEEKKIRQTAKLLIEKAGAEKSIKVETNDKDYIFINFILNHLPKGLIGLIIAIILSAGMSSTSSEINALATTTSMDLIKRNFKNIDEKKTVYLTKIFTLFWGICAIIIACVAFLADNLIQLVNIIGSIFYGNVLGIFLIALFTKKIRSLSVFTSAIITQITIIYVWWIDIIPFLWLNVLGFFIVTSLSILIELFLSISNFSSSE